MYLHEPKASENAAYECNIQPFFTFTSAIMCLLPTFTIIIAQSCIYFYYCNISTRGSEKLYLSNVMHHLNELRVAFR